MACSAATGDDDSPMWGTLGERLGTSTSVHSALLLALAAKSVAADAFGTCCGPGRAPENVIVV
jgi:hypothetical protein